MNWKPILFYMPYVLLVLANFLYIYANGFGPIGSHPELILYNIMFFLMIGVIVIIKVNLLLHSWFVS